MKIPQCQHGVIYADPPWMYEMYSEKGEARSPQKHYGCMALEALMALREPLMWAIAQDAVCIMWATWAMLPQAITLMQGWGFTYKSGGSWTKLTKDGRPHMGTGYIQRSASEPYLIGTFGRPRIRHHSSRNVLFTGDVPDDLRDVSVSINTARREHSRKPDEMVDVIERLFDGPYLELFGRTQRKGWTVCGNETDKFREAS